MQLRMLRERMAKKSLRSRLLLRNEHEMTRGGREEERNLQQVTQTLWKVPIKTFVVDASSLFAPHCRSVRTKCTEKTILEQILDAPCRSILIRSSKNDSAVAYLLGIWFSSCTSVAHVGEPFFSRASVSPLLPSGNDDSPECKTSCFWLIINFILVFHCQPRMLSLFLSLVGFDRFCGKISAAWFIKFVGDAWEKSFTFAPVDEKRFIKISFLAEVVEVRWGLYGGYVKIIKKLVKRNFVRQKSLQLQLTDQRSELWRQTNFQANMLVASTACRRKLFS